MLRRGDAFGDLAILDGSPRSTAAAPATASATLLVAGKEVQRAPGG